MIDVEPLIVSELERMLPLPEARRADWADVLRRADVHVGWRSRLVFGAPAGTQRWRPLLVAVVVAVGLALAAVAIADGFGAFDGIGAAQHPQSAADLPPAVAAEIAQTNKTLKQTETPQEKSFMGLLVPDSARFLTGLPDGARVWVVATTTNQLCTVILDVPGGSANPNGTGALGCAAPLSASVPVTVETLRPDSSLPPLTWGVTLDNVSAVSFIGRRHEVTVPVKNNVWSYLGANSAMKSLTIHFTDGTTRTIGY